MCVGPRFFYFNITVLTWLVKLPLLGNVCQSGYGWLHLVTCGYGCLRKYILEVAVVEQLEMQRWFESL